MRGPKRELAVCEPVDGTYGRLIGLWCTRRPMGVPAACGPLVGMYYMAIGLRGTSRPKEAVRRS